MRVRIKSKESGTQAEHEKANHKMCFPGVDKVSVNQYYNRLIIGGAGPTPGDASRATILDILLFNG